MLVFRRLQREKDNNSIEQGTKVKVIALEDHRLVVELS